VRLFGWSFIFFFGSIIHWPLGFLFVRMVFASLFPVMFFRSNARGISWDTASDLVNSMAHICCRLMSFVTYSFLPLI
jgi:hypothetical protein